MLLIHQNKEVEAEALKAGLLQSSVGTHCVAERLTLIQAAQEGDQGHGPGHTARVSMEGREARRSRCNSPGVTRLNWNLGCRIKERGCESYHEGQSQGELGSIRRN